MRIHLIATIPLLLLYAGSQGDAAETPSSLAAENARLRKEVEQLRARLGAAESSAAAPAAVVKDRPADAKAVRQLEEEVQREPKKFRLEPVATVLDHMILRESVFDDRAITNPARVTYVRPGSGEESYSIDAGLAAYLFTFSPGQWQLDWMIGAEYHRNSAAEDLKDVFQTGLLFDLQAGNPATNPNTFLFRGSGTFKNDTVQDIQSVEGTLEVLPTIAALRIGTLRTLGPMKWMWQPFAGLLYEDATDTGANVEKGHRLMARYGAELQVYPLARWVRDRVEMTANYTAWSTLDADGLYDTDGWSDYFTASLKYWFVIESREPKHGDDLAQQFVNRFVEKEAKVGVSLTYETGEDPEIGSRDIDLLTLSLEAQF